MKSLDKISVHSPFFLSFLPHSWSFCPPPLNCNFALTHLPTLLFLAHLSRRLRGELIVYQSSRRLSVRPCVRLFTLSNMNISETNGSIATKFYQKHHWGEGLTALGFGPDRIRTLVSMATESSHRVIMEKTVSPLFLGCLSSDPFHTCR